MLFIQRIILQYEKDVRYSNYANVRRASKFFPVEFDKADITDEILFSKIELFQSTNGMTQHGKTKIYGENALFTGKFPPDHFGNRILVKRAENGYEILYKNRRGLIKSKFMFTDGKSGRIIYNERYGSYFDTSAWYYHLTTFNFVCADKDRFKPKIFFIKEPDFMFTDMKSLRYSGF